MTPGQIENLFVYEDHAKILKDILGSYEGPWQLYIGKGNDGVGYLRVRVPLQVPRKKRNAISNSLSRWEKEPIMILTTPDLQPSDPTGYLGVILKARATSSAIPCCLCHVVH